MGTMLSTRVGPLALAALATLPMLAGCADDTTGARVTCDDAIAAAAEATEVADQVRGLDEALLACGSYGAYVAALSGQRGLIGYSPETFVDRRCAAVTEPALRNSPTCRTALPPTTPPVATVPDVVYAAAMLDGRVIELRPSPAVPFAGEVPAVVQETVEIATASGCPGVLAQRDRWAGEAAATAGPPSAPGEGLTASEIASAYAQHAIHVAVWIGCTDAQLPPPLPAPATAPPAPPTTAG